MTTAYEHAVRLASIALDRTGLDDADMTAIIVEAITETGRAELAAAQAEVTAGILRGVELAVNRTLQRPEWLATAFIRARSAKVGDPRLVAFTAADLGLDALAVMSRVGASLPGD